MDCVHGAGGPLIAQLVRRAGLHVYGIGMEPDGRFPRDPEPTAANLAELGRAGARGGRRRSGFAIDPDVDRLSLVDENGPTAGRGPHPGAGGRRGPPAHAGHGGDQPVHQPGRGGRGPSLRLPRWCARPWERSTSPAGCKQERAVVGGRGERGRDPTGAALHAGRPLGGGAHPPAPGGRGRDAVRGGGAVAELRDREGEGRVPPRGAGRRPTGARGRMDAEETDRPTGCAWRGRSERSWLHVRPVRHRAGGAAHRRGPGRGRGAAAGEEGRRLLDGVAWTGAPLPETRSYGGHPHVRNRGIRRGRRDATPSSWRA